MENLIVASSNLYGLRAALAWPPGSIGQALTCSAILASVIYHLIERRKHGLNGLRPFATGTWRQHQICTL